MNVQQNNISCLLFLNNINDLSSECVAIQNCLL